MGNGIATPAGAIQQAVVKVAQHMATEVASLEQKCPLSAIDQTAEVFELWRTYAPTHGVKSYCLQLAQLSSTRQNMSHAYHQSAVIDTSASR
ncbi:MAG: hypothetical protein R2867_43030 [Caldilineaceae bacterium]